MRDTALADRVDGLRSKLNAVRCELRQALAEAAALDVPDYLFSSASGPVALSQLFDGKRELFVIHNMGTTCSNCTLWADGFNGLYPHLKNRAAFVVSSPDPPGIQASFAAKRGWQLPMVSHAGTSFAADMGFVDERGRFLPGVSVFVSGPAGIRRVSASFFAPGDDFCAAWHLFDLLPEGAAGWRPRFSYG